MPLGWRSDEWHDTLYANPLGCLWECYSGLHVTERLNDAQGRGPYKQPADVYPIYDEKWLLKNTAFWKANYINPWWMNIACSRDDTWKSLRTWPSHRIKRKIRPVMHEELERRYPATWKRVIAKITGWAYKTDSRHSVPFLIRTVILQLLEKWA